MEIFINGNSVSWKKYLIPFKIRAPGFLSIYLKPIFNHFWFLFIEWSIKILSKSLPVKICFSEIESFFSYDRITLRKKNPIFTVFNIFQSFFIVHKQLILKSNRSDYKFKFSDSLASIKLQFISGYQICILECLHLNPSKWTLVLRFYYIKSVKM